MNRVGEYIRFAVGFSGLGYLVLWPLTAHDVLHLSPGLHLAGMMSSACVVIGLALRPLRRRLRPKPSAAPMVTPVQLARLRLVARILPPAPPPPPRRYVQPRSHFGLRNAPH